MTFQDKNRTIIRTSRTNPVIAVNLLFFSLKAKKRNEKNTLTNGVSNRIAIPRFARATGSISGMAVYRMLNSIYSPKLVAEIGGNDPNVPSRTHCQAREMTMRKAAMISPPRRISQTIVSRFHSLSVT